MADFEAVLRKTLGGMTNPAPEVRAKVYDRARATITRQIEGMERRPSDLAIQRQFDKLEEAITAIEAEYAVPEEPPVPEDEPLLADEPPMPVDEDSDLDHLFETGVIPASPPPPPAPPSEPVITEPAIEDDTPETDSSPEPEIVAYEPAPDLPEADARGETYPEFEPETPSDDARKAKSDDDPLAAFLAEQETTENDFDFAPPASGETRERVMDTPETGGSSRKRMFWVLAILILLGAAGAAAYANRDRLMALVPVSDNNTTETVENGVPVRQAQSTTVTPADTDTSGETTQAANENLADVEEGPQKFTQRLTADGREIDAGPAQGAGATGEGTSVAGQTSEDATGAAAGTEASGTTGTEANAASTDEQGTLPVGQRAIFYQERTGSQPGTAEAGGVVWSVVQESPGGDAPLEPAIRGEASIPELGMTMEMTIRRNADDTFPASHVIELFFRVPETFEGRGIADVQRITLKGTEQDPGNALIGVAAPLDTDIFLIALTDAQTAIETNLNLLRREEWIDIPMQYISGRRALITLEKGIPGDDVFNEVLSAWEDMEADGEAPAPAPAEDSSSATPAQ